MKNVNAKTLPSFSAAKLFTTPAGMRMNGFPKNRWGKKFAANGNDAVKNSGMRSLWRWSSAETATQGSKKSSSPQDGPSNLMHHKVFIVPMIGNAIRAARDEQRAIAGIIRKNGAEAAVSMIEAEIGRPTSAMT
jgi:hypothetical protein